MPTQLQAKVRANGFAYRGLRVCDTLAGMSCAQRAASGSVPSPRFLSGSGDASATSQTGLCSGKRDLPVFAEGINSWGAAQLGDGSPSRTAEPVHRNCC